MNKPKHTVSISVGADEYKILEHLKVEGVRKVDVFRRGLQSWAKKKKIKINVDNI